MMFKVTVSEEFATEMNNVDNWPSGVEVRRYFFPKRFAECELVDQLPTLQEAVYDNVFEGSGDKAVVNLSQVETELLEMQVETNIDAE